LLCVESLGLLVYRRINALKNNPTKSHANNKLANRFLSDMGERFAYGLATLLFCISPFLIPGISIRQGVVVFFTVLLLLIVGIIIFSVMRQKKMNREKK
jgi:hypothetical protein